MISRNRRNAQPNTPLTLPKREEIDMGNDNDQQRLKHNDTGGHLGGTKFGQEPGTNGPNPAKPEDEDKKSEQEENQSSDEKDNG